MRLVRPVEGLPCWEDLCEDFDDAEECALGLVGLGLMPVESFLEVEDLCPEVVGLDLMPEESFLEGEDLYGETALFVDENPRGTLRAEDLFFFFCQRI